MIIFVIYTTPLGVAYCDNFNHIYKYLNPSDSILLILNSFLINMSFLSSLKIIPIGGLTGNNLGTITLNKKLQSFENQLIGVFKSTQSRV